MVVTIDRCCYKCHIECQIGTVPVWIANYSKLILPHLLVGFVEEMTVIHEMCYNLHYQSCPNFYFPTLKMSNIFVNMPWWKNEKSQNVQHLCKHALVEKWKKFQTSPYWCLGATTSHISKYFSFPFDLRWSFHQITWLYLLQNKTKVFAIS